VNVADPFAENADRLDRIAGAVKNHVGRIEVDAYHSRHDIIEFCKKRGELRRRLLPRLHQQADVVREVRDQFGQT
jgi:hypothetical protein